MAGSSLAFLCFFCYSISLLDLLTYNLQLNSSVTMMLMLAF
jgi:hypothetical protein